MRIINLIENTEGARGCICAHGLSFYIETGKHKLLFDMGPSEDTIKNAERLGVDLKAVDTVILSHGHYDHAGGIMSFTEINHEAAIYMQKTATGDYYADDGEKAGTDRYRYIGIDKRLDGLCQTKLIDGNCRIDDELELFTIDKRAYDLPFTNKRLMVRRGNEYICDDFCHEQYLVIKEGDRRILLSGCAHNGILSIMDAFCSRYGREPDVVISGFHLMKKSGYKDDEIGEILDIAKALKKYNTQFITCHCTGVPVYEVMKGILGEQLLYVHSGEDVPLNSQYAEKVTKRRSTAFMKFHKFFAWSTVVCFIITMLTGYKKK